VLITGGEPLLHSRFDEINEMLRTCSSERSCSRTASFSEGRAERLKVHEIQVSIDGMQAAHDALRVRVLGHRPRRCSPRPGRRIRVSSRP